MNKILIAIFFGLLIVSCGSKDTESKDQTGTENQFDISDDGEIRVEEIVYKGLYKGEINGKEVELKIDDESFSATENGKKINGNWEKVNDGTIIGLRPKSGKMSVANYVYSDSETWIALTDSLTYIEPEQYLKRVK